MRSWLTKSALAFGTISLLARAATSPEGKPAIALVDSADVSQWQAWTQPLGWLLIAPSTPATPVDARVQALREAVSQAVKNGSADPSRIYLVGRGGAAATVFYTISRVPDLWAGGVALGGSPQPAIDSDRVYAANFSHVPVLWVSDGPEDKALADKLAAAGVPVEWRRAEKLQASAVFEWLAAKMRPEHPTSIDCETNSPEFASCYWIRTTKLDAAERNDVLPSSRMEPRIVPYLNLGGFGYKPDDTGPGIAVTYLPQKYDGPLKMGDRIVELNGRPIANARQYGEFMADVKEERPATVMVQRGKERVRLETSILLPRRAPAVTARVQAEFDAAAKEIRIISRTVTEMRLTLPAAWLPALLNWNGVPLQTVDSAGCKLLRIEKELESAVNCP